MTSEFFGPLPPSDFNRDAMQRWLDQQVVSFQKIITGSLQADNILSSSNYVPGVSGWMIDGDGNAEFNDVEVRGDIISGNWDGADPIDLSSYDATASAGFALDSSVGAAQFMGPVRIGGDSNQRIEILKVGTIPRMEFYSTNALVGVISAPSGQLLLSGPASAGLTIEGDQNAFIDLLDSKITFLTSESAVVRATISDTNLSLTVPALLSDGSGAAPALAFTDDQNTGIYRVGADTLGITVGGANRVRFGSNPHMEIDFTSSGAEAIRFWEVTGAGRSYAIRRSAAFGIFEFYAITSGGSETKVFEIGDGTGARLRMIDGDASNPAVTFYDDTNTGIYRPAADTVNIVTGGVTRASFGATTTLSGTVALPSGTTINGSTAWHAGNDGAGSGLDADTLDGSHASAFASASHTHSSLANSGTHLQVTSTGVTQLKTPNTGSGSVLVVGGSGMSSVNRQSSALKYKTHITHADYLADIDLQPTKHKRKDTKSYHYGFIADWLAGQDELLGIYMDGKLEDYDTRAVVAVLAAKVNRLERQLERAA